MKLLIKIEIVMTLVIVIFKSQPLRNVICVDAVATSPNYMSISINIRILTM